MPKLVNGYDEKQDIHSSQQTRHIAGERKKIKKKTKHKRKSKKGKETHYLEHEAKMRQVPNTSYRRQRVTTVSILHYVQLAVDLLYEPLQYTYK